MILVESPPPRRINNLLLTIRPHSPISLRPFNLPPNNLLRNIPQILLRLLPPHIIIIRPINRINLIDRWFWWQSIVEVVLV